MSNQISGVFRLRHIFRSVTEVTKQAGVEDQARYDGFGIAWFDYNDDGKPELIVANDSTPNYLCRNRGDGTFEDVSYVSGTALDENGREQAQLSCRC